MTLTAAGPGGHDRGMVGVGIALGLAVLVAGLMVTFGLIAQNRLVLGLGFALLALCAIYGLQPGWPRRGAE